MQQVNGSFVSCFCNVQVAPPTPTSPTSPLARDVSPHLGSASTEVTVKDSAVPTTAPQRENSAKALQRANSGPASSRAFQTAASDRAPPTRSLQRANSDRANPTRGLPRAGSDRAMPPKVFQRGGSGSTLIPNSHRCVSASPAHSLSFRWPIEVWQGRAGGFTKGRGGGHESARQDFAVI